MSKYSTFFPDWIVNKHFFNKSWRSKTFEKSNTEVVVVHDMILDRLWERHKILKIIFSDFDQEIVGKIESMPICFNRILVFYLVHNNLHPSDHVLVFLRKNNLLFSQLSISLENSWDQRLIGLPIIYGLFIKLFLLGPFDSLIDHQICIFSLVLVFRWSAAKSLIR